LIRIQQIENRLMILIRPRLIENLRDANRNRKGVFGSSATQMRALREARLQ